MFYVEISERQCRLSCFMIWCDKHLEKTYESILFNYDMRFKLVCFNWVFPLRWYPKWGEWKESHYGVIVGLMVLLITLIFKTLFSKRRWFIFQREFIWFNPNGKEASWIDMIWALEGWLGVGIWHLNGPSSRFIISFSFASQILLPSLGA